MYEAIITVSSLFVGAFSIYFFVFKSVKNKYDSELFELKEAYEAERQNSSELGSKNAVLQERLRSSEQYAREKLQLLEENKEHMKLEFKELADNILKTNSEKLEIL